jgi:hypothetical protein
MSWIRLPPGNLTFPPGNLKIDLSGDVNERKAEDSARKGLPRFEKKVRIRLIMREGREANRYIGSFFYDRICPNLNIAYAFLWIVFVHSGIIGGIK